MPPLSGTAVDPPGAMDAQTSSPASRVELSPEHLFQTRTVDEIATFSRSLTVDIDRKREDLRTMVGERYRDLMEAAETITKMRESADGVIGERERKLTQSFFTIMSFRHPRGGDVSRPP